jgi:hypothetical protein
MKTFVKNILISGLVLFTSFSLFLVISQNVLGATNVLGWMWGGSTDENIGCSNAPCPPTLESATGLGWISLSSSNPEISGGEPYGITIDDSGNIQGYAWGEHVGWIQFDPSGPYPASPNHSAQKDVLGTVTGWARILSIAEALNDTSFPPTASCALGGNSGCWEGWIKLSGTAQNGASYGITIDASNNANGYAWSNELGWVNFADTGLPPNTEICGNGIDDNGDGVIDGPNCPEICTDNIDNDGDGFIDDADPDCQGGVFVASCAPSPLNPKIPGGGGSAQVTWQAGVLNGGVAPFTYSWTFSADAVPAAASGQNVLVTYISKGLKTAQLTVSDSSTPLKQSTSASCSVEVQNELNQDEVDPFFPFF